jgi:hypothetical protein
MNYADEAIHTAIREAERLRVRTKKKNGAQVKGSERDIIRATSLAWFNNHRKQLATVLNDNDLTNIDTLYKHVMEASYKNVLRSKYVTTLKQIGESLATLRSDNVVKLSAAPQIAGSVTTSDIPPDFSPLISDVQMKAILERRWVECTTCIGAGAPLAATVMMGGLLEGLLLARVNSAPNKAAKDRIFKAAAAPKDKSNSTVSLKDWTLQHFIDVARELGWISQTVKDIGIVLRDYRNYIHPHKEHSHGVTLSPNDAEILWEISKTIAREVLKP